MGRNISWFWLLTLLLLLPMLTLLSLLLLSLLLLLLLLLLLFSLDTRLAARDKDPMTKFKNVKEEI